MRRSLTHARFFSFRQPQGESLHRRSTTQAQILVAQQGSFHPRSDRLATEEPLEIRVRAPEQREVSVAVTMRTPGHDEELAVGFLYTEGLIRSREDILDLRADKLPWNEALCNVVTVQLSHSFDATRLKRNFYATSSCGVCGKASIEQIAVRCTPVAPGPICARSVLVDLPPLLRQAQQIFEQTGGLHAAGLFDTTGRLVSLREDVGRHNAMDKLVGQMVLAAETPLASHILLVSGRTSFEIMQKAAVAGVPIICAVSAPSSLAVETARRFRMTLIGFLRDQAFNVYTHPERIALDR